VIFTVALTLTVAAASVDPGSPGELRTAGSARSSAPAVANGRARLGRLESSPAPAAATTTPAAIASRPLGIEGARIQIDRLGIDLPLVWGDMARDVPRDDYPGETPTRVALVFPGSALPGTGGNLYVYAHARAGMFLPLWNARIGDEVVLRWPDGAVRSYSVDRIVPRVDPADTRWLDPSGPERLTLQTSTGPRASDPRFLVIALPVPPR